MLETLILGTSISLQLIAAVLAWRLVRVTGLMAAWLLVAGALVLMSVRRAIVFYHLLLGDLAQSVNLAAELMALLISMLMLLAVILIKPFVVSLRDREAIYRGILDNMEDTYYRTDADGNLVMVSASATNLLGYSVEELLGKQLADLYVHPNERQKFLSQMSEAGFSRGFQASLKRKDGTEVTVETNARMLTNEDGTNTGVEGTARNITERQQAELLNTRLGRVIEDSVNEIYIFDSITLKFILVNKGARTNLGFTMDQLRELSPVDLKPEFRPDEFEDLVRPLRDGSLAEINFETVHERKDGSRYPVEVRLQLARTEHPPVFFAFSQDISDRKRVEEELVQAQKMEAVGQLTGGIAHDFNNLLTVILGNLELAQSKSVHNINSTAHVDAAIGAANKGATLTQRLLAFSRKQELQPKIVDLGNLVSGILELLRRTVKADVQIEVVGDRELWQCLVDPTQLESALLNLTLNAQDAMPGGGTLTISTSNITLDDQPSVGIVAGDYVELEVSDTGYGMSPSVKALAFDPFFTTKEEGRGSGLGLSMVYGFVKQSGGSIDIASEPGVGTTVKIYLPRAYGKVGAPHAPNLPTKAPRGGGETVLVVEDDPEVGQLVCDMLVTLDYTPVHAGDAHIALQLLEENPAINLVLTDIVLPGSINGAKLARMIEESWPDLPVLFMSGYTSDTFVREGGFDPGDDLLSKPFTQFDLAVKLNQSLSFE